MYKIELSENYNNNIRMYVFKIKVGVLNVNLRINMDNRIHSIICMSTYVNYIIWSL